RHLFTAQSTADGYAAGVSSGIAAEDKEPRIDLDEGLLRAEDEAQTLDNDDPNFWNGVALADVALGRALLLGQLDEKVQQQVIAAYLLPSRRGASALQFSSVLEQTEFLIDIFCQPPGVGRRGRCDHGAAARRNRGRVS